MSGKASKDGPSRVPKHVAIIMDGNGRWAQQRGLPRLKGHEKGADSVVAAIRACRDLGVQYLTLYAFSVENWVRPKAEIDGLMRLLQRFLREREDELHKNRVRLRVIGRIGDLPGRVVSELDRVVQATASYDAGTVVMALSYGGRTELLEAMQAIAARVQAGKLDVAAIDEGTVRESLYAPDIPDPDLLIRTSGEFRISNFLLWQISYSELYFTNVLWPDFREKEFRMAVQDYARRRRRFGDVVASG